MKLSTKNVESINRANKEFGNFGITWWISIIISMPQNKTNAYKLLADLVEES